MVWAPPPQSKILATFKNLCTNFAFLQNSCKFLQNNFLQNNFLQNNFLQSKFLQNVQNFCKTNFARIKICTNFAAIPILKTLFSSATKRPIYWTLCSILYYGASIIQHKSFLSKIFKIFEEQVEDFFIVTSDSLVKKSSNLQLKSNKPFKLKYFKVLNVGLIPLV